MNPNEIYDERQDMNPARPWDAFWEQVTAPDASFDDELGAARASRCHAEETRQKMADEILEATKQVCQRLMTDGERAVDKARYLENQAEGMHREAALELERAQCAKAEADAHAERVVAGADAQAEQVVAGARQQALDLLDSARGEADRECVELRQEAYQRAEKIVAQAEVMRSAAKEELQAQRLYAEAARLKAESQEVLAAMRKDIEEAIVQGRNGANGHAVASFEALDATLAVAPTNGVVHEEEAEAPEAPSKPKQPKKRKKSD